MAHQGWREENCGSSWATWRRYILVHGGDLWRPVASHVLPVKPCPGAEALEAGRKYGRHRH